MRNDFPTPKPTAVGFFEAKGRGGAAAWALRLSFDPARA